MKMVFEVGVYSLEVVIKMGLEMVKVLILKIGVIMDVMVAILEDIKDILKTIVDRY